MASKKIYIYGLVRLLDHRAWHLPPDIVVWILYSQIRYVGKTDDLRKRYLAHLRDSKVGATHHDHWINSCLRDGGKIGIVVIEISTDVEWQERERFWIAWYNAHFSGQLTNHTKGGENPPPGTTAHPVSEETKQKLRNAKLGKPLSPAHCEAIRRVRLGSKLSEAHCAAISRALKGRKILWAGKMSAAKKGKPLSDAHRTSLHRPKHGAQGEKHHAAKFTDSGVLEIRRLYATGKYGQKELAVQFNVDPWVIGKIVRRQTWRHLL